MIDENHLPFFITEEIFLINEPELKKEKEVPAKEVATPVEQSAVGEPSAEKYSAPTIETPAPTIHDLAIWTAPLTAPDKELLVKILAAIKKDFNQAHLMEGINAYQPHYKELLCFGYQKELELKLGKSVALHKPTQIESRKVLVSLSPAELQGDPSQKKRLWEALQEMFL